MICESILALYALHILAAIARIRPIQERGDLIPDEILYHVSGAVAPSLQTLSESTQKLPSEPKDLYPGIPWQNISGFRNILVYNHLGDIAPLTMSSAIQDHLQLLESSEILRRSHFAKGCQI